MTENKTLTSKEKLTRRQKLTLFLLFKDDNDIGTGIDSHGASFVDYPKYAEDYVVSFINMRTSINHKFFIK